ncbi:MAG: 50S ribosomal protein L5 [Verrucomicrobiota bacterium JB023]|nr:50S ribosomal protein L5 [Verrucomicrobiota bacterium JB023]
MKNELKERYNKEVVPKLKEQFGLKNPNEVPNLEKIVLSTHIGHYMNDRKAAVEDAVSDLSKITGQKPSVVHARKSVANFKVREGELVGARVTLRAERMWEFLDRFINITAPNVRDFRGFPFKSFDGRGNYAMGINDQSIFPEIELDQVKRTLGFDLIIVTTTNSDEQAKALLDHLGYPFRKPAERNEQAAAA